MGETDFDGDAIGRFHLARFHQDQALGGAVIVADEQRQGRDVHALQMPLQGASDVEGRLQARLLTGIFMHQEQYGLHGRLQQFRLLKTRG